MATPTAVPTHDAVLAATQQHHELERWRAAQTVRAHIAPDDGQDAMLDCLGLLDLVPPPRG